LLLYILFEKYIDILALEMASPGKQQCANCVGTLSFPIYRPVFSGHPAFFVRAFSGGAFRAPRVQ